MSKTTAPKKDFATQKAEAVAAVEALHKRLAEGVLSADDWMKHLAFMSHMHSYSPRNLLLMWAQWEDRKDQRLLDIQERKAAQAIETMRTGVRSTLPDLDPLPELSYPAAFSTWTKKMGGRVRKGEKALAVLAPFTVTDWKADPDPVTGKHPIKVIGFVLKNRTFDISQTEGIDAPPETTKLLTGDGPEGLWDALVPLAEFDGWTVKVEPIARPGVNGYCSWLTQEIVVSSERERAQQVKTLAHEIAHKLLHEPTILPVGMPGEIKEVEAESVAYTVLNLVGFDSSDYSLGYVHDWAKGDGALIGSTLERVSMTATRVMAFLEGGELPDAKAAAKYEFSKTDDEASLAA